MTGEERDSATPNSTRRDFDAAAATWDENPARVRMAGHVARAVLDTVRPTREMDVLDFGCGTGLLTLQLRPHVRTITGIDSSQGMIDVLSAKIRDGGFDNVSARFVDLEKGEMPEGKYDLVVSSMTFHHIRDVPSVLSALASVMKPGGIIAIADLDSDEGKFHESGEGVFHNGFDRCIMRKLFFTAGFVQVRNRTAAVVHKPSPQGTPRLFTVFLMTARMPE